MKWARALELIAAALLFGWITVSPLSALWPSTATRAFGLPLAVLLVSSIALLGSRLLQQRADAAPAAALLDRGDWPLALLLVALLGSTAGRDPPATSWQLALQLALSIAGSYCVGKGLARSPRGNGVLLAIVLPLALAVALLGLLECVTGSNPVYAATGANPYYLYFRDAGRPMSTQFNPAPLGSYLLIAGFLGGGAALTHARWQTRRRRAIALLGLAVIASCLLLVRSRGAFMGLVAGLLVAIATGAAGRRLRLLGCVVGATALVVAISSGLPPPFDELGCHRIFGEGGFLAQDRMIRQDAAWAMSRDHLLFGVGLDQYPLRFGDYTGRDPKIAHLAGTPDNTFLTLLCESGLVGTAAFLGFVGALLARSLRAQATAADAGLLRAATAGLVALLVNFVGYSALYWLSPCLLFGVTCGLVSGACGAAAARAARGDAVAG